MRGHGVHSAIEDSARYAQHIPFLDARVNSLRRRMLPKLILLGRFLLLLRRARALTASSQHTVLRTFHRASAGRDHPSLGSPRAVRQSHPGQRCKDGGVPPSRPLGKTRRRTVRSRVLPPRRPVAHRTHGSSRCARGTGEPVTSQPVRISSRRSRFPSKSTGKSFTWKPGHKSSSSAYLMPSPPLARRGDTSTEACVRSLP